MLSAKLTQEQKLAIFSQCVNINAVDPEDPDRVYCWSRQEWVHCGGVSCSTEKRTTRADQGW